MEDDALEVVAHRYQFYRDNYRRVVMAVLILIAVNFGVLGLLAYVVTNQPTPKYFATTADGRVLPLYPLNAPMISKSGVLQWANEAAITAFNFDFVNWRKDLQAASQYFTAEGWKDFEEALKKSNNLETVISKKLVVNAVATGAPVINREGVINGRYSWNIQIPLLVTYQGSGTEFRQPVLITMLVTRVPILNNPKGIAIASFYASEQQLSAGR